MVTATEKAEETPVPTSITLRRQLSAALEELCHDELRWVALKLCVPRNRYQFKGYVEEVTELVNKLEVHRGPKYKPTEPPLSIRLYGLFEDELRMIIRFISRLDASALDRARTLVDKLNARKRRNGETAPYGPSIFDHAFHGSPEVDLTPRRRRN